MKIDLTCPVELWQYAMPAEDDMECTFVMNNLSDKVVTSVQVTLSCYDQEDLLLFRQTERAQGLKAGVGERFSILLLPTQWKDVEGVDFVVEKVWFDDATVWRHSSAPLTQYTPNALPAGRALDQLRFAAGKDAVGYPQLQPQVWMCVCGRANALDSQRCCRCERRRESVFASFTKENVDAFIAVHDQKLENVAKKAREDNSALAEARAKQLEIKRKRRLKGIRLALSALCLVAVVAVGIVWGIPTLRYNLALENLQHGQYAEARQAFAAMGDYRDAPAQITECDYQAAKADLALGDAEGLARAVGAFDALGDYEQSASLRKQALYELGDLSLADKRYEDAAEYFQQLGDYEDSADKLREATYLQADDLLTGGRYDVAKALFDGLAGYRESAVKSMECTYGLGKASFDAGDYEAALTALEPLGEMEGAPAMVKEAHYRLGENALALNDLEQAGRHYRLAGDYENAAAKADDCLYQYAQQLRTSGAYERAAALFAQLGGYLDSKGQLTLCVYEQAKALADAGDFAGALALLGTISGNEDADALRDQCAYELAAQAIAAGDDAGVEALLEDLGQYKDSEKLLNAARYRLAEAGLAAGEYEAALARYEALGTYSDSRLKARQCQYQLAAQLTEKGEYEQAAALYTALDGYEDSAALLQEVTYRLALQKRDGGDATEAERLLATIPDHAQAADALAELSTAEAQKLEQAGDYEGASALYEALGDSPAIQERYNACRYALGKQQMDAGELAKAGATLLALGDYQDAAALGESCMQSVYGDAAQTAREAYARQDYAAAAAALDGLALEGLPAGYDDLHEVYQEACYQQAELLYRDGKPYEALPYYQRVPDYKDVADKKLNRRAYLILGSWRSASGKEATFRADGTCDLMGEALLFRVSNFSLYTGLAADAMAVTHKLSAIDKDSMSLRDIRDGGDTVYKFDRAEAATDATAGPLPASTAAPAPTDGDDSLLVTGD